MSWKGRGDRNCTSVPTLSRLLARWFLTALAIASSFRFGLPLPWAPFDDSSPDLYAYRLGGALVWPWMSMIIRTLPVELRLRQTNVQHASVPHASDVAGVELRNL